MQRGKDYCVPFFLKIMGKTRTPVAEHWDPHQVSMKEIMSETKDKCPALFRVLRIIHSMAVCQGW